MTANAAAAGRVAYLVMSHALPDQVLRLVRTLRAGSPAAPVLIHHDDRHSAIDRAALRRLGGVELVDPPTAVVWGWASQLDTVLRCLAWLLERVEFDWMTMVSGQDYPLRPLARIEHDLTAGSPDGYVASVEVAPPPWTRGPIDEFSRRYYYRYRPIRPPGPRLRRAIAAARPVLLLRDMPWGALLGARCATPFSPALRPRAGPDWLSLSRPAVEAVVGAARSQPEVLRHYRRTIVPTESFAHTVLHSTPGLRLSGDARRFTSWTPGAAHPDVLRLADLERVLGSGADFARKFDMTIDSAVLDALDRVVRPS